MSRTTASDLFSDQSPLSLSLPGWPVIETGLLMAYLGRVLVVHISELAPEASQKRHVYELFRALDKRTMPVGVLYDVPTIRALDAISRKEVAAGFKAREEQLRAKTSAYTLVTPSTFVRGMLSALFWLAPPSYPYSVVGSLREGCRFVADHTAGVDADELEQSYVALLTKCSPIVRPPITVRHR